MLNIKLLRDNPSLVIERLKVKNFEAQDIVNNILELDIKRRDLQTESDSLLSQQNNLAKEIGLLMKSKMVDQAQEIKNQVALLKERSKELENQMELVSLELNDALVQLPNLPHTSVPQGRGASENKIEREWGDINIETAKIPHWELAKKYDIIDFD